MFSLISRMPGVQRLTRRFPPLIYVFINPENIVNILSHIIVPRTKLVLSESHTLLSRRLHRLRVVVFKERGQRKPLEMTPSLYIQDQQYDVIWCILSQIQ